MRLPRALIRRFPRSGSTTPLARIFTVSPDTTSSRLPGQKEAFHRRPGSLPGSVRAMGSNLRITRSATVGKEDQKNLLSKTRRTTPNGTTSNVLAEKPPSHWTSPVQIPGIQRYQLRAGTTAKRSASPRRPVVSGPKYGPNSSALKLAQGSVYAVHPAPHQGPKTGPKLSDYPPKEALGP